jgi:hypothetical protein
MASSPAGSFGTLLAFHQVRVSMRRASTTDNGIRKETIMKRAVRAMVAFYIATLVGGLAMWGPEGGFIASAEAKPKKKGDKGPDKGKHDLQKAYDALTDVAAWTDGGRGRPPRDLAPLIDRAKEMYRDAVHAAREDEMPRADELATAAHDAARGLVHALRADAPALRGIPAPPIRDTYELDNLLQRTRDRLEDVGEQSSRGVGRTFLDAARRLYDQARQAGREETARAIQLARAAEAWTHVGEHLLRANSRGEDRLPPDRRRPVPPEDRRRPPPPDDRRGPPPPPRD